MIVELSAAGNCRLVLLSFRDVHKQKAVVRDESLQTIFSGNKRGHLVAGFEAICTIWCHL